MNDKDPRQIANEELEEAVKRVLAARGHTDGLIVDWVLVTAQHIPTMDGSSATANGIYGPANQPTYRAAGLLKYATVVIDQKIRD